MRRVCFPHKKAVLSEKHGISSKHRKIYVDKAYGIWHYIAWKV